ncbi:MAG: c-type cytochrome, partial [Deltaproteobacteria bacterium]
NATPAAPTADDNGTPAAPAADAAPADGKALFLDNKCDSCHSVTSKGVAGKKPEKAFDLSAVKDGKDLLVKYLKKEVAKANADGEEAKHKKKWGGSDEELSALVDWLTK